MIDRSLAPVLLQRAELYPVVTVTGPRQSGKSTLCRALFQDRPYRTMESPDSREYALRDPRGFLAAVANGAILDEVQKAPDLLSYLQEEVDRNNRPGRFILTGSENLALSQAVSQSLAGRTGILHLLPCTHQEIGRFHQATANLWSSVWKGGFPRIFDQAIPPEIWFEDYVATYLERDVRNLLRVGDLRTFSTFLRLAAGRTAQELNLSGLSSDVGVSVHTVKAWISVLEASYLAVTIPAWHPNARKRAVKNPKFHLVDSGLACHLLGITSPDQLAWHPLRGPIFESWVVGEVLKARLNKGHAPRLYHYRENRGPEVDLLVESEHGWKFVEVKSGQTVDSSFFKNLTDLAEHFKPLGGAELRLVHGGDADRTQQGVRVIPWSSIQELDW
jgi:predicted AAA+ superfamily ATPase